MAGWSGGNDTGTRPCTDPIRIGAGHPAICMRNRDMAGRWLANHIRAELRAGRRLCIGFDCPFGYLAGFVGSIAGSDGPLALRDGCAAHVCHAPDANNRFDPAGELNPVPGTGPVPRGGNGLNRDVVGRRRAEPRVRGVLTCWQLMGMRAVGSQIFTGLPVLARLRARFPNQIAVRPFEPVTRPVAFVVQVDCLALALSRLKPEQPAMVLDVPRV